MKYLLISISLVLLSCKEEAPHSSLSSIDIMNKSIQFHDPKGEWDSTPLALHIEEPRIGNPTRYSELNLDKAKGTFHLLRHRNGHFSTHIVDAEGALEVYLDNEVVTEDSIVKKFRLDPERNLRYQYSYEQMLGLPMSLLEGENTFGPVEEVHYNQIAAYKIPVDLEKALFSKQWNIYIAKSTYAYLGMDLLSEEDPQGGERLYFEGIFLIKSMKLPRHKHWHYLSSDDYLGSDMIIKVLEEQ